MSRVRNDCRMAQSDNHGFVVLYTCVCVVSILAPPAIILLFDDAKLLTFYYTKQMFCLLFAMNNTNFLLLCLSKTEKERKRTETKKPQGNKTLRKSSTERFWQCAYPACLGMLQSLTSLAYICLPRHVPIAHLINLYLPASATPHRPSLQPIFACLSNTSPLTSETV